MGNNRSVISESVIDYDDGYGNYAGDNANILGGRMIYTDPMRSDTIYFRYPEQWVPTSNGSFMPAGEGSRDLNGAKLNFYRLVNRTIVPANNDLKRARQRAINELKK